MRSLDANQPALRLQDTPWGEVRGMSAEDVKAADDALKKFLDQNGLSFGQDVYRKRLVPATAREISAAFKGPNAHATVYQRSWDTGLEVVQVRTGASRRDVGRIPGQLHKLEAEVTYPVKGADGVERIARERLTLLKPMYGTDTVASVEHFAGRTETPLWERMRSAVKAGGEKVLEGLKHI